MNVQNAILLAAEAGARADAVLQQKEEKKLTVARKAERLEELLLDFFKSEKFLLDQSFVQTHESTVKKEHEAGLKHFSRDEKVSVLFCADTNRYEFLVSDMTVRYCYRSDSEGVCRQPRDSSVTELCEHLANKGYSPEESFEFFKEEFHERIDSLMELYIPVVKPRPVFVRRKRTSLLPMYVALFLGVSIIIVLQFF